MEFHKSTVYLLALHGFKYNTAIEISGSNFLTGPVYDKLIRTQLVKLSGPNSQHKNITIGVTCIVIDLFIAWRLVIRILSRLKVAGQGVHLMVHLETQENVDMVQKLCVSLCKSKYHSWCIIIDLTCTS